jgi:hypothetical protein
MNNSPRNKMDHGLAKSSQIAHLPAAPSRSYGEARPEGRDFHGCCNYKTICAYL